MHLQILDEHRRQGAEDQAFEKRVEKNKAAARKKATRRCKYISSTWSLPGTDDSVQLRARKLSYRKSRTTSELYAYLSRRPVPFVTRIPLELFSILLYIYASKVCVLYLYVVICLNKFIAWEVPTSPVMCTTLCRGPTPTLQGCVLSTPAVSTRSSSIRSTNRVYLCPQQATPLIE